MSLAYDAISISTVPGRAGASGAPATATTVAIVGLGYVGLPSLLAFDAAGLEVIGFDISQRRIDDIRTGAVDLIPADRARLDQLNAAPEDLPVTTDAAALAGADAIVVCVPTPVDHHDVPDLAALRGACRTVIDHARAGQVIILTSTTYVGCTRDLLVEPLQSRGLTPGVDVHIAFSPERIDPGNIVNTQDRTPRVLGGLTQRCTEVAAAVIATVAPHVHCVSSAEAAELTKLYENSFRAVNIAFANEMAEVASGLGLDVMEVIDAAATKPYGFMRFDPGPGVGGHCIPCDPHYLLWQLRSVHRTAPVLEETMRAIAGRPRQVVDSVRRALESQGRVLAGTDVLVAGVAYKPDVADHRESPALEIIDLLIDAGATVHYVDPHVPEIRTRAGRTLQAVSPRPCELAVVHTLHRGDRSWIDAADFVFDATYRLAPETGN